MRLTTKGRLAVTALVDLATRDGDAPVTLKAIGARRNISVSYLEQLFGNLRRNKIVTAVRGPGGGYSLADEGSKISVASIIRAVDGASAAANYRGKGGSRDQMPRCIDELWFGLNEAMYAHVSGISLQHLVDQHLLEGKGRKTSRRRALSAVGAA